MDRRHADELLLRELARSCERAATIEASQDKLPRRETVVLRRGYGALHAVTEDEVDWRRALPAFTRGDGEFWEHLVVVVEQLREDEHVDDAIGWNHDPGSRATTLWSDVLAPRSSTLRREAEGLVMGSWSGRNGARGVA